MDDRWDAFVEDDRLFLHRSWTGHGSYEAQFTSGHQGWAITELLVAGDRASYRRAHATGTGLVAPVMEVKRSP